MEQTKIMNKQKKIKNLTIQELNSYTLECLKSLETQHKLVDYWKNAEDSICFHLGRKSKLEEIYEQKKLAILAIDDLQKILVEIQKFQDIYIQTCKNQVNNQLANQPIVQFIYDFADDTLIEINATGLYKQFKDWCKENSKQVITQTKFGIELNKMEGFVKKIKKSDANFYQIEKK